METVSDEYIKKAEAVAPNVQVHAVNSAIEKALQDIYNREVIAREKVSQSLAKDTVISVRDGFNADAKAVAASEAFAIKMLMGGDAGPTPSTNPSFPPSRPPPTPPPRRRRRTRERSSRMPRPTRSCLRLLEESPPR